MTMSQADKIHESLLPNLLLNIYISVKFLQKSFFVAE